MSHMAYLSYEMVFTLIFREASIDLDGKDCQSLKHADYYSMQTLHCMKFEKVRNEWVRQVEGVQSEIEGEQFKDSESSEWSSSFDYAQAPPPALATGPFTLPPPPVPTPTFVVDEHHPAVPRMPYIVSTEGFFDQIFDRMGGCSKISRLKSYRAKKHLRSTLSPRSSNSMEIYSESH